MNWFGFDSMRFVMCGIEFHGCFITMKRNDMLPVNTLCNKIVYDIRLGRIIVHKEYTTETYKHTDNGMLQLVQIG